MSTADAVPNRGEDVIESQPGQPLGPLLFAAAALVLDVFAIKEGKVDLAIGSILPWLVAALLLRNRDRAVAFRLTEYALEVVEPPQSIPYTNLQGLLAPRRPVNPFKVGPRFYPIEVLHTEGIFHVPKRLTVRSDEVYSFLFRQFTPSGSRDIHPSLLGYVRAKERDFGAERVWTYRARAHLGHVKAYPRLGAFFLAMFLCGIVWLSWGIARNHDGWLGGGSTMLFLGGLFTLLIWLEGRAVTGRAGIKNWRKASLVIAPDGLALVQGDMTGQLRWDELLKVETRQRPKSFQMGPGVLAAGIVLKVAGAEILIADVYDRPLPLIYQQIQYYWHSEPADAEGQRDADSARPDEGQPWPPEGIRPPE